MRYRVHRIQVKDDNMEEKLENCLNKLRRRVFVLRITLRAESG